MSFVAIDRVVGYQVDDRTVSFDCKFEPDRPEAPSSDRTVPVTVEFLRSDAFRFRIDANPEGRRRTDSIDSNEAAFITPVELSIRETEADVRIESADLRVDVGLEEWSFEVSERNGSTLLEEQHSPIGPRDGDTLGFTEKEVNNGSYAVAAIGNSFALQHDERIYGLGEKFTALDKRGQSISSWTVKAQGTESERSYKNVPFYLSTRGYGLLVDTTQRVDFDFGDGATGTLSIDVTGNDFEFVFFQGPTFDDLLEQFTALTGRSRLPPAWSFGLWMSRAGYETRDQLEGVASRLREEGIPCDVLHLDPEWMGGDRVTDLEWDRERFPEPESMIESLHEDGFRLSLWEHPYVPVDTRLFKKATHEGYLVDDGSGNPYILDELVIGQYRGGIVDFTDPAAVSWWQDIHRRLLEMGVDSFKTDFGEDVPRDGVFADGRTGESVHNVYPNLYNQTVDQVLVEEKGPEDSVTWGRSAWAGGQRYPLYWGGDPPATFDGMASALRGGLSLSLSGFPFWSHDIGGFWGEPSTELYVRWAQFGLLSSHARCHGTTPREPWEFGEDAMRIFKKFVRLRYRLLPYIRTLAAKAVNSGLPVVRPLVLEYQEDPRVHDIDEQYLLGSDLLVAPVLNAEGSVDVYLPDGGWRDYWTGDHYEGERTLHREVPLESMPLFVRSGSVIPTGDVAPTVEGRSEELTFDVTLTTEGESVASGKVFDDTKEPHEVTVSCDGDRDLIEIAIPESDRLAEAHLMVHGLETDPEKLKVNGEPLPQADAGKPGWTYDHESASVHVRR